MVRHESGMIMKEEKKYYIIDPEFGDRLEVSKENHEMYMKMWNQATLQFSEEDKALGVPILFGTGGTIMDGGESFPWDIYRKPLTMYTVNH